ARPRQARCGEVALLHVWWSRGDLRVDPRLQGEAVMASATADRAANAAQATVLDAYVDQGVLIVHGQDRPGIVAAVSAVLARVGANLVALDQYSDNPEGGQFYQRTVFHLADLKVNAPALEAELEQTVGTELGLQWQLTQRSTPKRVVILASKSDHCLLDLLW